MSLLFHGFHLHVTNLFKKRNKMIMVFVNSNLVFRTEGWRSVFFVMSY